MSDINNREDIMDSRNVEERIVELQDERKTLADALKEAKEELDDPDNTEERPAYIDAVDAAKAALVEWDESSEADELKALEAFKDELEGYCEWEDGATLVRDSHFEDYAREYAEDIHGRAVRDASWPFDCIDWEKAAEALQMDYTSGEFDGVTYWAR